MKFIEPNTEGASAKRIILWWELRRIPYNLFILVTGIASLQLMFFVVDDFGSFISPPLGLTLAVVALFIGANFCYTIGWINQIIFEKVIHRKHAWFVRNSFFLGLLATLAVVSLPVLVSVGYWVITGERFKSVYAGATREKPTISDVAGEYELDSATILALRGDKKTLARVRLILKPDGAFESIEMPEHEFTNSFSDFTQANGAGRWSLDFDQGRWVVSLAFDSSYDINSFTKYRPRIESNGFELHGDKPPYAIYRIVGDPDSWEGLMFKRHDSSSRRL